MDKWTHGLAALDARQTRERLSRLMDECRFVAVGLEFYQGQGLRDQVASTQLTLERAAKAEIERLAGMLAEYRSGPPPEPPPYDPYAAARERAEAKAAEVAEDVLATEPESAPSAPSRPTLPVRGARLPRLTPGRPA
ncbi:hypothetical protein [Methylobacterium aquaticum]|uniref:hypothetical protein n=1 Tax=Methylobacterium aquaticum TaxID=270351 RepID=UPI0019343DE7|nr:hypothetical protein [Methylobacterium aquaticum]QRE76800.1 hypothetical protein F1D61_27515 [Methylobacterium aquaticum]